MPSSSSYEQDIKTQAQIEAIQNEIKLNQPLTSKLQPLSTLQDIYNTTTNDEDNHNNFSLGCQYLTKKYKFWRQIRGDGNCYYRAFLYALCESLYQRQANKSITTIIDPELQRVKQYVESSIDHVTKYGYDRFTIETFHEEFIELLDFIINNNSNNMNNSNKNNNTASNISTTTTTLSNELLHTKLNEENSTSDYCTWYLRVITSSHLKQDSERFIHYLDDFTSTNTNGSSFSSSCFDIHTFCSKEVDPMGKECSMVQVLALAEAFKVKVKIEYLDGREMIRSNGNHSSDDGDDTGCDDNWKLMLHEFGPHESNLEITLLYRPGHYDILYT